jgi:probable HAF family extracellular repeat protein
MVAALGAVSCTSDRTPTDPSAEINERAARTSAWTIQDLGTLGGTFSTATAINATSVVVGWSHLTEGSFERHAFVWQNGVMSDLGTRGVESEATTINRRGVIVGWSRAAGGGQRAVRWVNGTIEDLGVEGANSQALGINDFGVTVGWSEAQPFRGQPRAFRWEDGVLTDLGTLGGTYAVANAINHRGVIVGGSSTAAGDGHAFRWEKGVMEDLGTGGRMPPSAAADINDKGEIVGALGPEPDSQGSELERRLPFLYSHGVLAEIGDLGQQTFPNGISHRSLIVGERLEDPFDVFGTRDAWVWENGVFTLLPELSDGNSSALGVNRRDEIVGYSQNTAEGFIHAVLWRR